MSFPLPSDCRILTKAKSFDWRQNRFNQPWFHTTESIPYHIYLRGITTQFGIDFRVNLSLALRMDQGIWLVTLHKYYIYIYIYPVYKYIFSVCACVYAFLLVGDENGSECGGGGGRVISGNGIGHCQSFNENGVEWRCDEDLTRSHAKIFAHLICSLDWSTSLYY